MLPHTKLSRLPRMADFALWICACEGAFWEPGTFMAAYDDNCAAAVETVLEADAVGTAVLSLMSNRRTWEGTPTELLAAVNGETTDAVQREKKWPKDGRALSGRLRRRPQHYARSGSRSSVTERGRLRTKKIIISCSPGIAEKWEFLRPLRPPRPRPLKRLTISMQLRRTQGGRKPATRTQTMPQRTQRMPTATAAALWETEWWTVRSMRMSPGRSSYDPPLGSLFVLPPLPGRGLPSEAIRSASRHRVHLRPSWSRSSGAPKPRSFDYSRPNPATIIGSLLMQPGGAVTSQSALSIGRLAASGPRPRRSGLPTANCLTNGANRTVEGGRPGNAPVVMSRSAACRRCSSLTNTASTSTRSGNARSLRPALARRGGCRIAGGRARSARRLRAVVRRSIRSDPSASIDQVLALIEGIGPTDMVEAMTATMLVGAQHAALDALRRASHPKQTPAGRQSYTALGLKAMRTVAQLVEALHLGRGKAVRQEINVTHQHVTVEAGGQAVVGAIDPQRGRG